MEAVIYISRSWRWLRSAAPVCLPLDDQVSVARSICDDMVKLRGIKFWPVVLFWPSQQVLRAWVRGKNLCVTLENLMRCSHPNPSRQVSPYSMNPKLNNLLWDSLDYSEIHRTKRWAGTRHCWRPIESHRDQMSRRSRFCNHALIFISFFFLRRQCYKVSAGSSSSPCSPSWLVSHEQDIEQQNSQPSYQKLKTMVRRCLDQTIRTRNFEARNERFEHGAPTKRRRKISPRWKEAKRVLSMERKRTLHKKETLAVSVTMRVNFENQRAHPLLSQNRRQNSMGKIFEKNLSESVWEEISKTVQRLHQWETHEPLVDSWHPPCVRSTKRNRAANSVKKCSFVHREAYCQPNKRPKKMVDKVLLPYWRIPGNKLASSKTWSRRNLIRFYGRTQNPCNQIAGCKCITPYENSEMKGSMIQHTSPHERSPYAPKFEDRSQGGTLKQERCAAQTRVKWQKVCPSSNKKTKQHFTRLQKFGHYHRHLRRNKKKELDAHAEQERSELSGRKWRRFEYPETQQRVLPPKKKSKQTGKQQFSSTVWVYSWQTRSLGIRQQFYRLENTAKITDIPMSGTSGSKTTSYSKWQENTMHHWVRITCLSLFRTCHRDHPSSSSTSSTWVSQDSVRDDSTPCPATTRSKSKRSRALGDQFRDSKETKNHNKNEDTDRARGKPSLVNRFIKNLR